MTGLLSAAEYAAIAQELKFPTQSFVNGASYISVSGKTFTTINPATNDVLAEITACNAQDVDFAVAKAKEAFEDGRWHKLSPGERKKVLLRFADRWSSTRTSCLSWKVWIAANPCASASSRMFRKPFT